MSVFQTLNARRVLVPFVVLVAVSGCDLTCPIEPSSPIVSTESEEAQTARAEDEAFRKERQRQESKARAKGKARRLPRVD